MFITKYRPEIDGLRALAVLAIVLFHAGLGVPGGYVGVDVFFVISGFLITGNIHRGLEHSTFSLVDFWERRIRRIFPALFAMVMGTLGIGFLLLPPRELEELGKSSIAQAFLIANIYFWSDTGYFAGPAELKPLLHTWSLAIEEHFYLFFPPFLAFVKTWSRRALFSGVASIAAVSFLTSIFGLDFYPNAVFFLLPTRAWELLIGCMLAVLPCKYKSVPRRDGAIALAGLSAIILPLFLYDSRTLFPGLAAIPPVFGAAAVIFATAATPGNLVCRALSLRPVVFVGLISYSLYLWHWPIIVFVRIYWGYFEWKQAAFALACSLLLSGLSWRFIELPFRRSSYLNQRRRLSVAALLLSGVAVAIGIVYAGTGGVPARFPNYNHILLDDISWAGEEFAVSLDESVESDALPSLGVNLRHGDERERLDFIIWGDSHARTMCGIIDELALELNLSGRAIVTSNVPPLPNVCMPFNENIPARKMLSRQDAVMDLLERRPPRSLIIACRWSWYTDGRNELETWRKEKQHLLSDDRQCLPVTDTSDNVLSRNLELLVYFCKRKGIALWIIKQVPETGESRPAQELFQWTIGQRSQPSNNRRSLIQHHLRQSKVEAIFRREAFNNVRFLDPAPFLFDGNGFTVNYSKGRSLYRDSDHLTKWGLESIRGLMTDALREIKGNKYQICE
jgi:peptidoglycan/LPS O-acetylase OafA/YrhL